MAREDMVGRVGYDAATADERVTAFLRTVYGWMCVGLAVTAVVAFYVASSLAASSSPVWTRTVQTSGFAALRVGAPAARPTPSITLSAAATGHP